ncbi:MAG: copper chaperone PCu(A)C [Stellaceae bacterium]
MMQRHWRNWRAVGRGASALALVAALSLAGSVVRAAEPGMSLHHPWMRTIIPSRPAAGYFTLKNDGAAVRTLTGAQSSACGTLMLHKSVDKNGVDHMIMQKRIPVPAHGTLTFAPGGYHLMCMKPTKAVRRGNSVPVTLKFADGGTLTASFPVHGVGGK